MVILKEIMNVRGRVGESLEKMNDKDAWNGKDANPPLSMKFSKKWEKGGQYKP